MRSELNRLVDEMRKLRESIDTLKNTFFDITQVTSRLDEITRLLKIQNINSEYWEFDPITVTDWQTLKAGSYETVLSETERGLLIAVTALSTSANVLVDILVDDLPIRGRIQDLIDVGLVGYNPRTFWVSSATSSRYTVWLTPVPYLSYNSKIVVTIRNLDTSDVQYEYSIYRYKYVGD